MAEYTRIKGDLLAWTVGLSLAASLVGSLGLLAQGSSTKIVRSIVQGSDDAGRPF